MRPVLVAAAAASTPALFGASSWFASAATMWPQPASSTVDFDDVVPLAASFSFKPSGPVATGSKLLWRAFQRYEALLNSSQREEVPAVEGWSLSDESHDAFGLQPAPVTALQIEVQEAGDTLSFGVDESYSMSWDLSTSTSKNQTKPTAADSPSGSTSASLILEARTVFGALRGLETFAQLVEGDNVARQTPLQVPLKANISDSPRFPYRGLMMDYSRHYYPVSFIEHTIDAMAASKLNVLHMHITDDESFPMQSKSVPSLAAAGAFRDGKGEALVYTAQDMQGLTSYAQDRGVLLVPEFDMPAHSASWGAGEPDIVINGTGCSPTPFAHGDVLNPSLNRTYEVLDQFLGDMVEVFTPPFLHLGGDEVPVACWAGNEGVTEWMKQQGIAKGDYNAVERYFVDRVASLPSVKQSNRTIMYWEEVFNNNASISDAAIIQAWKSDAMPAALKAGHTVTNSYKWYLNHGCNNYGDGLWADFYENDPITFANESGVTPAMLEKVLGGETTMWSECVDAVIFDAIVWPRAAAAAEQLWSPRESTRKASAPGTAQRMAEHRCRLVARGVGAAPVNDQGGTKEEAPRRMNPGCQ